MVKEGRFYGEKNHSTGNASAGVRDLSVCRHLSQVCRGARLGDPVYADVTSGPRVGISAGIPARVRGVRDGGGGCAPDPEATQIWSRLAYYQAIFRNSEEDYHLWQCTLTCP